MTSLEQRDEIKQLVKVGVKAPQIASQLGISVHTVRKWRQLLKIGVRYTQPWVDPKLLIAFSYAVLLMANQLRHSTLL